MIPSVGNINAVFKRESFNWASNSSIINGFTSELGYNPCIRTFYYQGDLCAVVSTYTGSISIYKYTSGLWSNDATLSTGLPTFEANGTNSCAAIANYDPTGAYGLGIFVVKSGYSTVESWYYDPDNVTWVNAGDLANVVFWTMTGFPSISHGYDSVGINAFLVVAGNITSWGWAGSDYQSASYFDNNVTGRFVSHFKMNGIKYRIESLYIGGTTSAIVAKKEVPGSPDNYAEYTPLLTGLPTSFYSVPRPDVFYYNDSWYMIMSCSAWNAQSTGAIYGYKLN